MVDLKDLDGDGLPEMVVGSIRTDLIDAMTAGNGLLDAQLTVLRNGFGGEGGFVRPAALVHSTSVPALEADNLIAVFFGDCDRDGFPDLLVRDRRDRLQVWLTRERGGGFSLTEPVWEMQIHEDARVRVLEGGRRPSLLIVERNQLVHVRMR